MYVCIDIPKCLDFQPGYNPNYFSALGEVIHPLLTLSLLTNQMVSTVSLLLFIRFSADKWDLVHRRTW